MDVWICRGYEIEYGLTGVESARPYSETSIM